MKFIWDYLDLPGNFKGSGCQVQRRERWRDFSPPRDVCSGCAVEAEKDGLDFRSLPLAAYGGLVVYCGITSGF